MSLRPLAALSLALAALGPARAAPDRFEPNQTRRTAARVEAGDYPDLTCDGEDWYAVELAAGLRLEVSVHFQHADGDLDLEVQDARGATLAWSRRTADEEAVAVIPGQPQALFVRVHGPGGAYRLHVGLAPDRRQGDQVRGADCWGSDWYPVEVEAGNQLTAALRFQQARIDLDLELLDEAGAQLAVSSGREDREQASVTASERRRLLVHVFNVQRSRGGYDLDLRLGPPVAPDLKQALRLLRPEGAGQDLVLLQGGEQLQGTVLTERLHLSTAWGELLLPRDTLAGLDLRAGPLEPAGVVTVHDDRLRGYLRDAALSLRLNGVAEPVVLRREQLERVVFGRRGQERAGGPRPPHAVVLRDGERFRARLVPGPGWSLDLGFATVPVDLSATESLLFDPDGTCSAVRRDQASVRGRLSAPTLELELALGEGPPARVQLHPMALSAIHLEGSGEGRLSPGQLRHLLRRLAPELPAELLGRVLRSEELTQTLAQVRAALPLRDEEAPELRRHLLAVSDPDERFAWFEVVLRVDARLRERTVSLLGEAGQGEAVRLAAAASIAQLAIETDRFEVLEPALVSPTSATVLVQAAMQAGAPKLTEWLMNRQRHFRGGRVPQVEAGARRELMELLPRLLDEE